MSTIESFQQFIDSLNAEYQKKINLLENRIDALEKLQGYSSTQRNHTITDFCEENRISKVTFHKMRKRGLPAFKIGRKTLIDREAGRKWVQANGGAI